MTEGAPAPAAVEAAPQRKGPPPEQIEATVAWATRLFSDWYRANPPPMPPRFGRREFGFIPAPRPPPDRTPFFRHMAMRSREELHEHVVRTGPWHCYYSTAYYEDPAGPTMKDKGWLGADLIFDLDADHLKGAETMSFEAQLDAVKTQTRRLLDEFLLPDFGFDPANVRVVFSGGRGYHIHVDDPRVLRLGSAERREIVDYVSPPRDVLEDLLARMRTSHAYTKDQFTRKPERDVLIPRVDEPGWRGRSTRYVVRFLEELATMPREAALARLQEIDGVGPKKAEDILDDLTPERIARTAEGRLEAIPGVRRHLKVLEAALLDQVIRFAPGETDEPVTADIKRLIRLPGSLHGKSGLRVTPIPLDALPSFEPLRDAVALPTDRTVKVVVAPGAGDVRLGGERVSTQPGPQELPVAHAAFLVLRRKALVPWQGSRLPVFDE
ncbi:MAG TPA: DNA primase small subunit PriS [Candidatus Thermoplasmatota archaeon]|nr:DNA primase small subunit PriS [Candidatus Thermoplasmatota archaeon]